MPRPALGLSHQNVIILMNSLLANLICSQPAQEKRQSHSMVSARSRSGLGPLILCHLFVMFSLLPGAFDVEPDSLLSQNDCPCFAWYPRVWAMEGRPPHQSLLTLSSECRFVSLPQWTSRPMTAEIWPSCSLLDSQHLGGMWEVPNKDLLNDYVTGIIIYRISCELKGQNLATAYFIYNSHYLCLLRAYYKPGTLYVILLMVKQPCEVDIINPIWKMRKLRLRGSSWFRWLYSKKPRFGPRLEYLPVLVVFDRI